MSKNFQDIPKKKEEEEQPKEDASAMEFLMTYGWAILVVIAAIAALAYFGVIPPKDNTLLPGANEPLNTTTGKVYYYQNVTCADIQADEITYNLTGKTYDCADNYKEIVTNESMSRVIVK